jgi:hypothetical protein
MRHGVRFGSVVVGRTYGGYSGLEEPRAHRSYDMSFRRPLLEIQEPPLARDIMVLLLDRMIAHLVSTQKRTSLSH